MSILAFAISCEVALFALSWNISPDLPGASGGQSVKSSDAFFSPQETETEPSDYELTSTKQEFKTLQSSIHYEASENHLNTTRFSALKPHSDIVAAFYLPSQELGLWSLKANADKLTHIMPVWLHLRHTGTALDFSDWDTTATPQNLEVAYVARRHNIKIIPVLNNAEGGEFDPERVHKLLASPAEQRALAREVRSWLMKHGFQGINLNLENLYPGDYMQLPGLLSIFRRELEEEELLLSVNIEAGKEEMPLRDIADMCDFVVLKAYDEHYSGSEPGPIASIPWYQSVLKNKLSSIPPDKLVIGVGNYAYDWTHGDIHADALPYQSALDLILKQSPSARPEDIITFDAHALNPTFEYRDEKSRKHRVWLLDGVTAYNQWLLAYRQSVRGTALWVLGSEDPSVWTFMNRRTLSKPPNTQNLTSVRYPRDAASFGQGDLLEVRSVHKLGQRRIKIDDRTGLCISAAYVSIPVPPVIMRSGYAPGAVVLTFDDGPDRTYTPQILRELKRYNVRATFFVIGQSAAQFPALVRRIRDEGHEIGNHSFSHPDMGKLKEEQAAWELNASQRITQGILGKSTHLWRPPSGVSSKYPTTQNMPAIRRASELGYITVGHAIDPQDWLLDERGRDGKQRQRTAEEIAQSVLQQVRESRGNVIVLHDGGGDRSRTVAALRQIIPRLRSEGFRFVTVSELLNQPREAVMSPLSMRDRAFAISTHVDYGLANASEKFIRLGFFFGIILGIARFAYILILVLFSRRRERTVQDYDTLYKPLVSVVIPAHNEELVILRTVESVLESSYSPLEVIVVDDGSTDGTAQEVTRTFGNIEYVRLIIQDNQGKAVALNNALSHASGEILFCIDADTQITKDAIGLMVCHFIEPDLAAVAGNVKIGNRINALTKWQSIEYITGQNLDRRGGSFVNAITVVPGAFGAFRKSAVIAAGGYLYDTLAEDMDLTLRLRRMGWILKAENRAIAFTEAPSTIKALFKQRFRWAYGTLQCLYKHRASLFRYGHFGWVALPSIWTFQILFQLFAPVVDLYIVYTLAMFSMQTASRTLFHQDWQPAFGSMTNIEQFGLMYGLFLAIDTASALIAYNFDNERFRSLRWLPLQRFLYRQIIYVAVWKSLWKAVIGARQGWGKLERKGTVRTELDSAA